MLDQFIASTGGATQAASVLGVSGTILHRWRKTGLSKKASARIELWLEYSVEQERFILRNVWAKEDYRWAPSQEDYLAWARREFKVLNERVGFERASALWSIIMDQKEQS